MKQRVGKTLKDVAIQELKSEKRRNVMVIIAVALASFLISFTSMLGISLLQEAKNKVINTYEAVYLNVSEEDIEKLKNISEFEQIGEYYIIGEEKSDAGFVASFFYADNPMFHMARNQVVLSEGQAPESVDEIVVSKDWIEKYEKDAQLGKKIKLDVGNFSGEYIISGILEKSGEGTETFPFFISKDRLKEDKDYNKSAYLAYVHMNNNIEPEQMKEFYNKVAEKNKMKVSFHDNYFRYAEKESFLEQIPIMAAIAGIVLIGSCIVIQSIFQISIMDKIQSFGQLRTIGATKKQLKKIIKSEGRRLGVIGISIGIILGGLSSLILVPNGFEILSYLFTIVVTTVLCYSTLALSMIKPIKVAAKVTPIEASKLIIKDENIKSRKRNGKKLTPLSLGKMNFMRDKKKVFSIVASLSIGGILLLVICSIMLVQDPEQIARRFYPNGDFKIYLKSDRGLLDILKEGNPLNENLKKEVLAIPGVQGIEVGRKTTSYKFRLSDVTSSGLCDLITNENRKLIKQSLVEGSMPEETYGIILMSSMKDSEENLSIGKELEFSLGEKTIPVTIAGFFQASQLSIAQGHGKNGLDAPLLYIPEALAKELLPEIDNFDYSWEIVNNHEDSQNIEKELNRIVKTYPEIAVDTFSEMVDNYKIIYTTTYQMLQILSWLIFLFGIINLVNTTLANQLARKYENSILRAVGLTGKQFYKMIICEGIYYILGSIVTTLVIGIPISIVVSKKIGYITFGREVSYHFPFMYMTGYMVVLCSVVIVLSIWTVKKQQKQSIIDQLRDV